MAQYQVTCITLGPSDASHENGHQRITHIGGPPAWRRITVAEAIITISLGNSYFVKDADGKAAWVRVVTPRVGRQYLRTVKDDTPTDNLLALPPCR